MIIYSGVCPIVFSGACSQESMKKIAASQHNPMHEYPKGNPFVSNGTYSQESLQGILAAFYPTVWSQAIKIENTNV